MQIIIKKNVWGSKVLKMALNVAYTNKMWKMINCFEYELL
jgi:hypothetical protein